MRRCLLWMLLALLPWRLWALDVMALQPCHSVTAPVGSTAHPGPGVGTLMAYAALPEDGAFPTHAFHHLAREDSSPGSEAASHASCTLCDLCHNPALVVPVAPVAGGDAPRGWSLTQWRLPPAIVLAHLLRPPIA